MDSSEARVLETTLYYGVSFETIDGVKTPRIDVPDFIVGDLEFHLDARNIVNEKHTYAVYMELSEVSKKKLASGYEIKLTSFEMNYTPKNGSEASFSMASPKVISTNPASLYNYSEESFIRATMAMEFRDVFPHRLQFVDANEAKKCLSDCKIVLKDDGNKKIFVHKHFLAYRSPFFQVLFFGDFKEKDQDEVPLSDVTEEEFLEYLFCIYPPPNRPFAFKRLDSLLRLADRYQNDFLTVSIEKFLKEKEGKTVWEKKETLVMADLYNLSELFRETLETMDKTELKMLDPWDCKSFEEDNMELLISHLIDQL